MSDIDKEPAAQEAAPVQEKQLSEVEQRAMDMGWRPREEFDGDDIDFVDAKEFVGRKPIFDKLEASRQENKATRRALEAFKEHHTKVKEAEYQRALKDLKASQKQALSDGDVEKYYKIEEEKEQIEEEKEKFAQEQQNIKVQDQPQVHPELAAWQARNPWYMTHPHMQAFADQVGVRLQGAVRAGTMTAAQVLKTIEKEVRDEFPNRFRNANKDKPSAVEGTSRKSSSSASSPSDDSGLTEQERNVMNTLVRGGHMTKAQYLAELKQVKEKK